MSKTTSTNQGAREVYGEVGSVSTISDESGNAVLLENVDNGLGASFAIPVTSFELKELNGLLKMMINEQKLTNTLLNISVGDNVELRDVPNLEEP